MPEDNRDTAEELERLIDHIDRTESSQVELEKLRSALNIVLEREKGAIARDADRLTWDSIVRLVAPLLLTGLGGLVALKWQSCEHAQDDKAQTAAVQAAASAASAQADREANQRGADLGLKARQERIDFVRDLAAKVTVQTPPTVASCRYAFGLWADYTREEQPAEDPPKVLTEACGGFDAGALVEIPDASVTPVTQDWRIVLATNFTAGQACAEASRAGGKGIEHVQVYREGTKGPYATTSAAFETRAQAVEYLQLVRVRHPTAYAVRASDDKWDWCDCTEDGGVCNDKAAAPSKNQADRGKRD